MQPSSTYSRLLCPVIASSGAVGLSIGLIIPLTSVVLEHRGISIIAIGLNATVFFILLVLRREGAAALGENRIQLL